MISEAIKQQLIRQGDAISMRGRLYIAADAVEQMLGQQPRLETQDVRPDRLERKRVPDEQQDKVAGA